MRQHRILKALLAVLIICTMLITPAFADSQGYINANNVCFRKGPGTNYAVIGVYSSGKALTITGTSGDWTSCVIDGNSGYVFSVYVSESQSVPAQAAETAPQEDSRPSGGNAIVIIGNPNGSASVSVSDPAPSAEPAEDAPSASSSGGGNAEVVIGRETPRTTPAPSASPAVSPAVSPSPSPSASPAANVTNGSTAYVTGDYVRFRTGPSTSYTIITMYNKGTEVTVLDKSGDWTKCSINGREGFISSQYISSTSPVTSIPTYTTGGNSQGVVETNSGTEAVEPKTGYVCGNNVRFRKGPSTSTEIIGEFYYGNAVTINGKNGDWYSVNANGKDGYVYAQYVKEGTYTAPAESSGTVSSGNVSGDDIVAFAKQYLGYKYVWGGASPEEGFDCSGFVSYVYKHFGYSLNRVACDQAANGVHVDNSKLKPGDVLCFYTSANYIGHTGIYIGGGKFIHSANSNTGVIITDLTTGYYADRGYEARRIIN